VMYVPLTRQGRVGFGYENFVKLAEIPLSFTLPNFDQVTFFFPFIN
jgi:hypothetical protein